jgi:hypothetical protein
MQLPSRTALRFVLGLGVTLGFAGCAKEPPRDQLPPASAPSQPAAPAPATTAGVAAPAAAAGSDISGTVVETMNSGGYTYAKIDRGDGTQVWTAGPETPLAVGAKIAKVAGTLMPGFHSNTLNRTFDQIYFVTTFTVSGGAMPNPHGAPPASAPAVTEKLAPVAGGKTVAEIFAGKDALNGKPVVVRGKVVKVNSGILGRNWVHLQDGTGNAGTSDLMVTTTETVAKDAVVVVRGTVATNKDFGAGYSYAVLVENASFASQ